MKLSVLVVDDEALIRKSLSKVLRAKGYAVETASTGEEGLEKAAAVRPQVMILDMRLPDTDGLSVLRRVRQIDPVLQVILITAYGEIPMAFASWLCDRPYAVKNSSFSISPGVTGANSFSAIVGSSQW